MVASARQVRSCCQRWSPTAVRHRLNVASDAIIDPSGGGCSGGSAGTSLRGRRPTARRTSAARRTSGQERRYPGRVSWRSTFSPANFQVAHTRNQVHWPAGRVWLASWRACWRRAASAGSSRPRLWVSAPRRRTCARALAAGLGSGVSGVSPRALRSWCSAAWGSRAAGSSLSSARTRATKVITSPRDQAGLELFAGSEDERGVGEPGQAVGCPGFGELV